MDSAVVALTNMNSKFQISEPSWYDWAVAQSTDPDTAIIYDHQLNGEYHPTDNDHRESSETTRILRNLWAQLYMNNDLLFFKDDINTSPCLVIPGSMVLPVLSDLHHDLG
ncbi:unnamed protein product [Dibothriocephalus latus]|uniref:Uncharacterized protein n=1 Tax=Dibothriocephalus latus TaxID=60516 RepID=A0A3P7RWN8_DIBLA|nr:unnamed protein product [Dibothriocephalus latus]